MKTLHTVACAAILAALPITVPAQNRPANPADAQAAVPVLSYHSATERYQAMADDKKSPADNWHDANRTVAEFGSMAGMSMDEKSEQDMPGMNHGDMPMPMPSGNPAKHDAPATGHAHH